MLKKQIQEKQFRQNVETVDKCLKTFGKSHDAEALHKLRVAVKKMKALILLQLGSFNEEKLPDAFEKIKKVFKNAGKVRDAAVTKKLLKAHHVTNKKIKAGQEKILEKEGKKFRSKIDDYGKDVRKHGRMLLKKFADKSDLKTGRLISNELRLLSRSFRKRLGHVQLHECRKKLKNLLYVFDSLNRKTAEKIRLNKSYLKELEETIGNWHDMIVILDLLKENGYATSKIPQQLLTERTQWRRKVHDLTVDFGKNATAG